eukprot:9441702-Alexandrium_andersonii.AAC.1
MALAGPPWHLRGSGPGVAGSGLRLPLSGAGSGSLTRRPSSRQSGTTRSASAGRAPGQCCRQGQPPAVLHRPVRSALFVHFESQDDPDIATHEPE